MQYINHYICYRCHFQWRSRWETELLEKCPSCRDIVAPFHSDSIDSPDTMIEAPDGSVPIWYDDPYPDVDKKEWCAVSPNDNVMDPGVPVQEDELVPVNELHVAEDAAFLELASSIALGIPCDHPG